MIRCRTREVASSILSRISKGEDPEAIVRSLSGTDDVPRAEDLGLIRPGDLRPPLNTAAATLSVGAATPVIESAGGFVILRRLR